MDFRNPNAQRIDDYDIPRIASYIGVGEDEIHAFMEVEAAGSGFDSSGRPKMLFEPHKFYIHLGEGPKRDAAVKAGLAYKRWGGKPYPKESYTRLAAAMQIDADAAIKSCSWGLTQILGEYYDELGYASPLAMVQAYMADEAQHLEDTIKLLKLWKIDDDLRAHRWEVVARAWNGAGYAKHNYHGKLKAAYIKWTKIKDTVWPPKDWKADEKPVETPKPAEQVTIEVPVTVPTQEPVRKEVVVETKPIPTPTTKPRTGIVALLAIVLSGLASVSHYFFGG